MKIEKFENNPLLKLSFEFALLIVSYCELLEINKKDIIKRHYEYGSILRTEKYNINQKSIKHEYYIVIFESVQPGEDPNYAIYGCLDNKGIYKYIDRDSDRLKN